MRFRTTWGVFCAAAVLALAGAAQQRAQRPLTHGDYDGWNSITGPVLSRDGKLLAYGLFPQDGDGFVVVKQLPSGKEWREAAGALPPPPDTPVDELPAAREPRGVRAVFTRDGRYLVSTTFPPKAEVDAAKEARKKPEEMPKGGLVILNTSTGAAVRIAGVKNMQVPEKGGDIVAYLKEAPPAPAASAEEKKAEPAPAAAPGARNRRREFGTDLVLRDLTKPEPRERTFANVLDYALAKDGRTLVFTVSSKNEEDNGVFAVETDGDTAPVALLKGKGRYTKLVWDREATRAAFLSDRDDAAARPSKFKLYLWDRGTTAAYEASGACNEGFRLSDTGTLAFSRDGSRVLASCALPAPPSPPAGEAAAPADDKVVADLWHWKDDVVQPMQKVQAARERTRSYTAVYHIADRKFLQLADRAMRTVHPSDSGRFAIGADDHLYRRMADYDAQYADEYIVDTLTGTRRPVLEKMRSSGIGARVEWSPDGNWVLFYRDKNWHTLAVPDGHITSLTSGLGARFWNNEDDRPEPPYSFGAAGWTSDSRFVLLYDRHDIWQVSPDGRIARNLTEGYGRSNNLQFRVVLQQSEDEEGRRGIDPEKALLVRAENLATRETGFFRERLNSDAPPQKLLMAAKNFRALAKAKDADVVLFTESTFHDFPDLQVADGAFARVARVSDANPQKAQLLWGAGELIGFRSADGVALQAALYKPANFDPEKKYPMLVYIYERLSQNVHSFVDPRPGTSINLAYYVSNGYVVLTPDIVYTVGAPGQSALKCVLPAIQAVVDKGFIDESAIGIQGHSWGGYQTAYLVGHTNRFRAAEAGAPVGNMTSAYNGIRWGSGMPRQFQYEQTQSRIGGTLWQSTMAYIENSPIFSAPNVQTPLLILHDDQDDAVPWYQGIELFLSLRRLGKEAYLFNYNGELHGLRRRQNQKDYTVRMQQFFDHFLKGAAEPEWMERGIPYTERETEKERFRKTAGAAQ